MIDIGWLLGNYYFAGYAMKPLLTILYEDEYPEVREQKADLLQYLITYWVTQLQSWIRRIRKTDFSSVK
jgi:hypothetical protein